MIIESIVVQRNYISHFISSRSKSIFSRWKSMCNIVQLAVCLDPSQTCQLGLYNPSTQQLQHETCLEETCRRYQCDYQWVPHETHKKHKNCPKITTEHLWPSPFMAQNL